MTYCRIILWLASTLLLIAFLPFLLDWLIRSPLGEWLKGMCKRLCRIWVTLAFLLGFTLGGLVLCCWPELRDWVADDRCRGAVLIALVMLLLLLHLLLMHIARCGMKSVPWLRWPGSTKTTSPAFRGVSAWWLIILLAALILYLIWRCCGEFALGGAEFDLCARLVVAALLLFVLMTALRYLAIRICEQHDPKGDECRRTVSRWVLVVIVAQLATALLIYRCCDALGDRDYDLAMVAIWWEGNHGDDERGAHLRWSFRYDEDTARLPFPEDGFDLQRRPSGTSAWVTLNPERIVPVTEWGDEAALPAGEMWRPQAVERLHPDDWDRFRGTPFTDLLETLNRTPYQILYYVEDPLQGTITLPSAPFNDIAARDAWLDSYYAQDTDEEPMPLLGTWEMEPLSTLLMAATHTEIARMIGLAYVDTEAVPDVEYDYRIVGYWADRARRWTVKRVSAARTAALTSPVLDVADSPLPMGMLGGKPISDDRAVGLSWTPPVNADTPVVSGLMDSIRPLLFSVEHQEIYRIPDEGVEDITSLGSCALPVSEAAFAPARRNPSTPASEESEIMPPSLIAPLEDDFNNLSWPDYFFFHRALPYGCHAYRVIGKDIFGRIAAPSNTRVRPVKDLTPPPPPTMVRVLVYQRSDPSLAPELQSAHFPTGSDNEFSIQISWVWPAELAARAPDLIDFNIYSVLSSFDPFPGPGVSADPPVWREASQWSVGPIGPPVSRSSALPLPGNYAALDFGSANPLAGAEYFEVRFTEAQLLAFGISLANLGLEVRGLPGDQNAVRYSWFGVSAVDRSPYDNEGDVSPPILAVARDLYPPNPPAAPALSGGPFEANDQGNRALEVAIAANALYRYSFYRLDAASVTAETGIPDEDLPLCFDLPPLVRPPNTSDVDWTHMQRRRAIHETVARDLGALTNEFERMSSLPINVEAARARFSDTVDATETHEYLYAAVAIDQAGNPSALSCPSKVIVVEDGVPPRPPVFREVVGGDGTIRLTWTINPEADLYLYNIYRTEQESRIASRSKLHLIAGLAPDGTDVVALEPQTDDGTFAGTGAYATITFVDGPVVAGTKYYYRMDAQDIVGNRSPMSGIASGAAFDATPPEKLIWEDPAAEVSADSSSVILHWAEPAQEAGLRIQLQRRPVGTPLWRTLAGGWLDGTAGQLIDTNISAGSSYEYRVRGMDSTGNRAASADWSDIVTVSIPAAP